LERPTVSERGFFHGLKAMKYDAAADAAKQLKDKISHAQRARFYSHAPGKKSEQTAASMSSAAEVLARLRDALADASSMIQGHADFMGGVSDSLHLTNLVWTNHGPELEFGWEPDVVKCGVDGNRWNRWSLIGSDGKYSVCSSQDVIKRTGCSQDYLDGITSAIESTLVPQECRKLLDAAVERQVFERINHAACGVDGIGLKFLRSIENRRIISFLIKHGFDSVKAQVNSLPSLQDIQVRKALLHQSIMAKTICEKHNMPPVPPAKTQRRHVVDMESFPGVYFGWRGGVCTYVGKSVSVRNRLRNHNKISPPR
jgi:hypothetical protein